MARLSLFSGALLLLVAGLVGLNALRLPPEALIAPGAAEVRVVEESWGRRVVRYRPQALPSVWMRAVADRLEERGWLPVDRDDPYRRAHAYRRVAVFGPLCYIEQVELRDERGAARVSVRSQVVLVWRQLGGESRGGRAVAAGGGWRSRV